MPKPPSFQPQRHDMVDRRHCSRLVLLAALFFSGSVATAQVRPAGRTGLPQEHEYQKQLRAFLGKLTAKDYALPAGALQDVPPKDLDARWRNWALSVDVPRIGAKRSAPSLNL